MGTRILILLCELSIGMPLGHREVAVVFLEIRERKVIVGVFLLGEQSIFVAKPLVLIKLIVAVGRIIVVFRYTTNIMKPGEPLFCLCYILSSMRRQSTCRDAHRGFVLFRLSLPPLLYKR